MNQTKPCPVCKGPATTHSNPKSDSVCCVNEACPMWHEWIPLEKWNYRPEEDVLHAEIVRLTAERDALREVVNSADLTEALAAYSHDCAWSGWMKYMFGKGTFNPDGTWTMPAWGVTRWQMQMNLLYIQLPDEMRNSDRAEAKQMLDYVRLAMPPEVGGLSDQSEGDNDE